MECENVLLVQAEFDGELDAAEALRAAQHRQNCAACRDAYAQLSATHSLLRESAPRYQAPESLRRAIRSGLNVTKMVATPPPARPRRPWWRDGLSFGVGAALAACLMLYVVSPGEQSLLDQVVASHVRALQPGHLEDVVSTDQHTVKPWFDGKLDFSPRVVDLAGAGFPLVGGRLDALGGRSVAALVYRRQRHIISVYEWPAATALANAAQRESRQHGYTVLRWTEDGMHYVAVSDVDPAALRAFAQDLRGGNATSDAR